MLYPTRKVALLFENLKPTLPDTAYVTSLQVTMDLNIHPKFSRILQNNGILNIQLPALYIAIPMASQKKLFLS